MSQDAVRARFGGPDEVRTMIKTSEGVFGPIEGFWAMADSGASITIWRYAVRGGDAELYFLDDDEIVGGTGFDLEGVVY